MSNYTPNYQPADDNQQEEAMIALLSKAILRADQERGGAAQAQDDDDSTREIDLVALFWHIIGKLKWVIFAAILGAVLAGVYAFYIRVPEYSATAKLYVLSANDSVINISDLNIGSALTNDYQEVFKTWEVHETVLNSLDVDYSYTYLQKHLTVTNPTSTRVLYITYSDTDPQLAQNIANLYANAAQDFIKKRMSTAEPNKFSTALIPSQANGRSKTTYVIIGFILGAVLAVAIIVATFLLDDRPRTPDEITRVTGLPVLSVVPRAEKSSARKSSSSKHHHSSSSH